MVGLTKAHPNKYLVATKKFSSYSFGLDIASNNQNIVFVLGYNYILLCYINILFTLI